MAAKTRSVPMFLADDIATTGEMRPLVTPLLSAVTNSSCVISSPSRYFSVRSSSTSATASTSFSRAASTASARSAGISDSLPCPELSVYR
ncbi:MAG: hypothetical protein BWY79_00985 [Actinobacteria bacterium ADurb.Bin444]|nr:MAG: hypothetical protein BWY79_00985 [Actinobacteria bacterium ADurb.Bin444]